MGRLRYDEEIIYKKRKEPHMRLFEVNTNNNNPVTSFDGHKNNVTAAGFQKDGKWMFTGSEDGTVKVRGGGGEQRERK
jgi:G protein beta subunit-like protein